jgi:hypothetical protein
MQDPTQIDLAPFLAAIIEQAGGEIRLSYSKISEQDGLRAITIDMDEDGDTLVFSLTAGIPDED